MTKLQIHHEMCDQLHQTYATKNHDYGDSFAKTRAIIPNAILVRLHDKLNRLTTLMTGENAMVLTESIDDTLLDLANYALMELTERRADELSRPKMGCAPVRSECELLQDGCCLGQKGMPRCDSTPAVCDIRKGDI